MLDNRPKNRADGKHPSGLKICIAESKEKGFSKGSRKSHEKIQYESKNKANMWSTEISRICEKYIEKQPKQV